MFSTASTPSDDLTVTANQLIKYYDPKIPSLDTIQNLEKTMFKVEKFLSQFEQTQKEIENIHEKITSIEFLDALKLIKAKKKEKNGNGIH